MLFRSDFLREQGAYILALFQPAVLSPDNPITGLSRRRVPSACRAFVFVEAHYPLGIYRAPQEQFSFPHQADLSGSDFSQWPIPSR